MRLPPTIAVRIVGLVATRRGYETNLVADRYQSFANSTAGKLVTKRLGMPVPTPLRRYEPGQPVLEGTALLGAAAGGRLIDAAADTLRAVDAEVAVAPGEEARRAADRAGVRTSAWDED